MGGKEKGDVPAITGSHYGGRCGEKTEILRIDDS